MAHTVNVTVNGKQYQHEVEPRLLLVHDDRYFLRNHFFGLFSRYRHGIARYAELVATTRRTDGGGTKWRAS